MTYAAKIARLREIAQRERKTYEQTELPALLEWAADELSKRQQAECEWIKTRLQIAQDMRKGRG